MKTISNTSSFLLRPLLHIHLVPENKTNLSLQQFLPAVVVVVVRLVPLPGVDLQLGVVSGLRRPDPVFVHLPQVLQHLGALLRALAAGVTFHFFQPERPGTILSP